MKELKDYIELQRFTGISDLEIITSYFIDNDMEEEAMSLTYNLAKSKIEKMNHVKNRIQNWAYYIPTQYLYEKYSLEVATMLHRIELDYIINGEVTDGRLEWAKENIPNIKKPTVYFMPCMDWLEERGIKFKKA